MLVHDGKGVVEPSAVGGDRVEHMIALTEIPQPGDYALPVPADLLVEVECTAIVVHEGAVRVVTNETTLGVRVGEVKARSETGHDFSFLLL